MCIVPLFVSLSLDVLVLKPILHSLNIGNIFRMTMEDEDMKSQTLKNPKLISFEQYYYLCN